MIIRDLAVKDGGTVMMEFCTEGTVQVTMGAIPRQATRGRVKGSGLERVTLALK